MINKLIIHIICMFVSFSFHLSQCMLFQMNMFKTVISSWWTLVVYDFKGICPFRVSCEIYGQKFFRILHTYYCIHGVYGWCPSLSIPYIGNLCHLFVCFLLFCFNLAKVLSFYWDFFLFQSKFLFSWFLFFIFFLILLISSACCLVCFSVLSNKSFDYW